MFNKTAFITPPILYSKDNLRNVSIFNKNQFVKMKMRSKNDQIKSVKPLELKQFTVISCLFKHFVTTILTFHSDFLIFI